MNQNFAKEKRKLLLAYLKVTAKNKGLTATKIAQMTGMQRPNVSRMFAAKHPPTLDNFISLCQAIGVSFKEIDTSNTQNEIHSWISKRNSHGRLSAFLEWFQKVILKVLKLCKSH